MNGLPYPPGLMQEWFIAHLFRPEQGLRFWLLLLGTVFLFAAVLFGLQRLGTAARRRLTIVCTFCAGLFYALTFFLPTGSKVKGTWVVGAQEYPFTGDRLYRHPQERQPGEPAPTEPEPDELLSGAVELVEEPALEPAPGVDLLPVEGRRFAGGEWELTITGADGPVPLVAAGDGTFAAQVGPQSGALRLNFEPSLNFVKGYEQPLGVFQIVLFGFAIGLGIISLFMVHGRNVAQKRPGRINSLAFFFGFFAMTFCGLWNLKVEREAEVWGGLLSAAQGRFGEATFTTDELAAALRGELIDAVPHALWMFDQTLDDEQLAERLAWLDGRVLAWEQPRLEAAGDGWRIVPGEEPVVGDDGEPEPSPMHPAGAAYDVLFTGLYIPLESTTFALLGFYIVSAAYRAFRIRSTEAALITVVAFIMMMGQVPLGQALTSWIPEGGASGWMRIENVTNWLLSKPAAAAFRGILFGAYMGWFALSLRVWLSLERGSYFGKEL